MMAAFLDAIAKHRDAMIDFTRELIAIPTENPPGHCYGEARRAIIDRLGRLDFGNTRAVGECVLSFLGEAGPTVYFSGHYDVVPAQDRAQFEPSITGVNLFGRGAADMKAGLAAMIYAAVALREFGLPRTGRIGLVFVPDEETAGSRGSRHLEAEGLLGNNAIAMFTPEPTGGVIWNANRGAITLRVTVEGKTAHVGRPRIADRIARPERICFDRPHGGLGRDLCERRRGPAGGNLTPLGCGRAAGDERTAAR